MAVILDGKKLRDKIFVDLKQKIDKMDKKPSLVVILGCDIAASHISVRKKKKSTVKL